MFEALDRLEVFAAVCCRASRRPVCVPEDGPDLSNSWSSPEHYDRWSGSSAPTEMLRDVRHLLAEEPEARVYQMVDAIS